MKTCTLCKIEKPLDAFHVKRANRDGLQTRCKMCQNGLTKQHYEDNKQYYIDKARRQQNLSLDYVMAYLRASACVDCGNSDIRVLEFDHVRGEKKFNVTMGARAGMAVQTVKDEVAKCEVRCANCHRIATYERATSWRS